MLGVKGAGTHLSNLAQAPCAREQAGYRIEVQGDLGERAAVEDGEQAIQPGDLVEDDKVCDYLAAELEVEELEEGRERELGC